MKSKKGFTLIELLFVVSMLAIIVFLVLSVGTGYAPKWKLSSITSKFVSNFMFAKQESAKRNTYVKIEFDTNSDRGKTYTLSYYDLNTSTWKEFKRVLENDSFYSKNDVTNFVVSPRGTIYNVDLTPRNTQIKLKFTITRGYTTSFEKNITIYPYGGIKIER